MQNLGMFDGYAGPIHKAVGDNRSEVRKTAVQWMREHPFGDEVYTEPWEQNWERDTGGLVGETFGGLTETDRWRHEQLPRYKVVITKDEAAGWYEVEGRRRYGDPEFVEKFDSRDAAVDFAKQKMRENPDGF